MTNLPAITNAFQTEVVIGAINTYQFKAIFIVVSSHSLLAPTYYIHAFREKWPRTVHPVAPFICCSSDDPIQCAANAYPKQMLRLELWTIFIFGNQRINGQFAGRFTVDKCSLTISRTFNSDITIENWAIYEPTARLMAHYLCLSNDENVHFIFQRTLIAPPLPR